MTIEERVNECIHQIRTKGYYVIDEEPNEETFEFVYKVQKSGEYFLDLTPAKEQRDKKWVLRDDPKHAMRESVIKTNDSVQNNYKSQKLTTNLNLAFAGISALFVIVSTVNGCRQTADTNERIYKLEQRLTSMPSQQNRTYEKPPKIAKELKTSSNTGKPVLPKPKTGKN